MPRREIEASQQNRNYDQSTKTYAVFANWLLKSIIIDNQALANQTQLVMADIHVKIIQEIDRVESKDEAVDNIVAVQVGVILRLFSEGLITDKKSSNLLSVVNEVGSDFSVFNQ